MPTAEGVIRADHNAKFYTRFLLLGLGALGFMLYCLYDGIYRYPVQLTRYEKYIELRDANRGSEWELYAEQQGWSTDAPGERTEADITMQFIMASFCFVVGTYMLLLVAMAKGRWIEWDGDRITTSWGQTVDAASVTEINKKRWPKQGIARIKYADGGRTKTFVLDDFKFVREPTDEILYELEGRVGFEKITDGTPEPDPTAEEETDAPIAEAPVDHLAEDSPSEDREDATA